MALQPSLRPLLIAGTYDAPHTLDIFSDYVCPFSAKLSKAINEVVKPSLDQGGQYHGKVKAILRLQVQPWHATSTYTHEAALAVARVSPEHFWPFSLALFQQQEDYFDQQASNLTPNQIREKLATLAASVIPADRVPAFKQQIAVKGPGNSGTAVTDDLKYTVKFSRQNGVHVSPSVLWDGIIDNSISSSWGKEQWTKFFSEKVVV
ncbi:hypothetical protein CONPUDRAFT_92993 [Coniophora puteana RWD-64-598 SS2]|uniref:Thioredoxin-like fold domain-containing protein n=1 Tax=Coniophora puteana (strain RWD-64-598) TaxID=741705 RepID=A0A5M3MBC3_CONPW|nr:uncharacterized protein CONPUDRAFT_92993 [Coniophora puteana RWD-64-598 SS2]EIW76316.1 hypothetical protein CONPUDRAFT_92993 [Coniophora puteana RWD-64-598 SS2]